MALQLGETLGRYQLEEQVGQGGMAVVYRAVDTVLGRTVAVKVIRPAFTADLQFVDRFLQEARLVAGLDHPGILPVYDFGDERGSPYLVLPYLPGGTLADRIEGRPQPLGQVAAWLLQLASALDAAHAAGVLHRDLKPGNVLIGNDGRLVLGDFGIARLAEASTRLTATGMVVGTPLYMAPELARGADAGAASDRYALGVIAYEMLAGQPPFAGSNALSILHQQVHGEVPALATRLPELPRAVDLWLRRALAKDPQRRPPSARAMAEELVRLLTPEQRAELSTLVWPGGESATGAGRAEASTVADTGLTLELPSTRVDPRRQGAVPPAPTLLRAPRPRRRGALLLWALAATGAIAVALLMVPREWITGAVLERPSEPPGEAAQVDTRTAAPAPDAVPVDTASAGDSIAGGTAVAVPSPGAEAPATNPSPVVGALDGAPAGGDALAQGDPPATGQTTLTVEQRHSVEQRQWAERLLQRPARRLAAEDFRRLAAEAGAAAGGGPMASAMRAAREWALGGLAYAEGDAAAERTHRAALAGLAGSPGPIPWGIAWPLTVFRDDPWALAALYADARGELAGLLRDAPGSGEGATRRALAAAVLAHLEGDHAGAVRGLGEAGVDPATSGGSQLNRSLVAQLYSIESLEAGDAEIAARWRSLAVGAGRAPLLGPFLLESMRLAGPEQAAAIRAEGCRLGVRQLCGEGMAPGDDGRTRRPVRPGPLRSRRPPPAGGAGEGG